MMVELTSEFLEMPFKVRMSSKGQIVIPKPVRKALDLNEGDELLLIPTVEGIRLTRPTKKSSRLRGLLKGLDVDIGECEAILEDAKKSLLKINERYASIK